MAVEITRPGKYSLILSTPVMPAAGTFGFGDPYKRLIDYDKLGAMVTNPASLRPRYPARGQRVVPLESGVLVHTGLPNPGLHAVVRRYRQVWDRLPMPVILHLVGTTAADMEAAGRLLDEVDEIQGIELGLDDDIAEDDAFDLVAAATAKIEKPLLVRLPFYECGRLAVPAVEAGADALVVCGAPRGTARDERPGRLLGGRIYGPLVKPLILRLVGRLRRQIDADVPIIASGGIHSPQDARDFIEAGAVAVQVDAAIWVQPKLLERIARDLGGWIATRPANASDWHPDMDDAEAQS